MPYTNLRVTGSFTRGRGWITDVEVGGLRVTQMWWYRQQILRLPSLHMCGRLLNDWLINMFCRMEDEIVLLIRRHQASRVVKRQKLCEVLANTPELASAVGTSYYLPSSVPGYPRHLKRLRIDALELARRRGPPSFLITLTCNPYWPEIQAALRPGHRPDITMRVFHERFASMVAFLKRDFAGQLRYLTRVIEYQRRGLPHAHIALAVDEPPCTSEEIDKIISCEVPREDGYLRDFVLKHMMHNCNHSCHPDVPAQECIKGCPWPFLEETVVYARGYPHHRRRDCGKTCRNCKSGQRTYGKRGVCCNRLLVESASEILLRWDGHANVKFAGAVRLLEYLYKYLLKGPDHVIYNLDLQGKPVEEITD